MPLLNYTTSISASKTAGEIQELLERGGASSVSMMYRDGEATGVIFQVMTQYGERTFSLPVNASQVESTLIKQKVANKYSNREQSNRVAWRIIKDWLEAQMAIIETEMVTLDQVMLPYMQGDNGQTVYELYRNKQLALESGE